MKKIILLLLLLPLLAISQNTAEYGVFENALLIPNPTQINQFEKGLAEHNKKYHGDGPYGARVYWISSGPNTGGYIWTMGPFTWSSLDSRPTDENGHDADWNSKVAAYTTSASGSQSYWRTHDKLSRFPKDFTINYMAIDYYDVKRGKNADVMKLVEKVNKAYAEKVPDETFGIYTNEFGSTKEGRDFAVISFFDKSAYLGQDNSIASKYNEMYGDGSWDQFLKDWMDATEGGESELWMFRPDLSGISGEVKVENRN